MKIGRMGEYAGGLQLAYQNAIDAIAPGASDQAAQVQAPNEDYLSALLRVAGAVVTTDAQRKLLNVQIDRANKGLPPLDMSQYGAGVNVGLSPETLKMLGFGVGALALVFLLTRSRR